MKITFINRSRESQGIKISHRTLDAFIDRIKYDTTDRYIEDLRRSHIYLYNIEHYIHFRQIPQVCFQCEMKSDILNGCTYYNYNGIVALKVGGLNTQCKVDDVKRQAMRVPQTICAFQGGEGQSVIILCGVQYPDGGLPNTEHKAQIFHAHAYQLAVKTYSPSLVYPIDIELPELTKTYLMPLDPDPIVNEHPTLFILDQPSRMPEDELGEVRFIAHRKHIQQGQDEVYSIIDTIRALEKEVNTLIHPVETDNIFAECKTFEEVHEMEKSIERPRLIALADKCAECSIPEEEATAYMIRHFYKISEQEIRDEMRNAYTACTKPRYSVGMKSNKVAALEAQEFIERRYDIQLNEVKGITEFRPRQSVRFMYQELTSTDLNTICHEAALEGLNTNDGALKRYIFSSHTRRYNPITEFLDNLPKWDGKDRISELFESIPNKQPDFVGVASTWFLSMVSHWLRPLQNHANSTAIILIGKQGVRKSTFCKNILPPQLSEFYTDSIDFRNDIEAERFLSRFMLINIDEFDQLSDSQAAYIKHMFQKTQTAHRELFRENITNHPRYASFIGTTNKYDILSDPTGNRRFLCVEVTGIIPTEIPIDYNQLYAQAVSQINSGVRCFINDEDEAKIKQMNRAFEKINLLENVFLDTFEKTKNDDEGVEIRPSDMIEILATHPELNVKDVSEQAVGRLLMKYKFPRHRKADGIYYLVKPKTK